MGTFFWGHPVQIMILRFKSYGSVQILMGDPHIWLQIRYQIFTSFINSHQLNACIQIITKPEMHTGPK